ncbi:MAG TPA: tetratricopeptide repeat protein [Methanoregulaceae archaeon]|nr:tetratricopeptide repeat protein [Methanoregulaceae archaeon]
MASGDEELYQLILERFKRGMLESKHYERLRTFLKDDNYSPRPDDSEIWNTMGNTFFKERDLIHALQCYENAIEIDHNNEDARYNRELTLNVLNR